MADDNAPQQVNFAFAHLKDNWSGTVSDYTGVVPGESSGGGSGPTFNFFTVDLHGLRGAEDTMYQHARTAMTKHEELVKMTKPHVDSQDLFGLDATVSWVNQENHTLGGADTGSVFDHSVVTQDLNLQGMAEKFGPHLYQGMVEVLNGVAQVIQSVGQFTTMLNNTGQIYTKADHESAMPHVGDPVPPAGPGTA